MEQQTNNKGKIFAIIFLVIIVLPVTYGLIKALVLDKHKEPTAQPAANSTQK